MTPILLPLEKLLSLAQHWLECDPDPETRAELQALMLAQNREALHARLGHRLTFGTAGLRAEVGCGSARMNQLVIEQTSAALAETWLEGVRIAEGAGPKVVLAYDARLHSKVFAEAASRVFAHYGFDVLLGTRAMATPAAAFAMQAHHVAGGAIVTASHNPPQDNGYKVYNAKASQILPSEAERIATRIEEVADRPPKSSLGQMQKSDSGVVRDLDAEAEERYLDLICRTFGDFAAPIKVAYSAMHGVGARYIEALTERIPNLEVHQVQEQQKPDGRFPTVAFPNPEEPGAMDRVLRLATQVGADLALANDPDADRLAVVALHDDSYHRLTGNDVGVLLGEWRIDESLRVGVKPAVATTFVSSPLLTKIATRRGGECVTTATGFKWIMHEAQQFSAEGNTSFVFGYEEAIGYGFGYPDHSEPLPVRDKDGIAAFLAICQLASLHKAQEQSLIHRLHRLWREFGIHLSGQKSMRLSPDSIDWMAHFREQPPTRIGEQTVTSFLDYKMGQGRIASTNALQLALEDGTRMMIRPSGTEPKLKIYVDVVAEAADSLEMAYEKAQRTMMEIISDISTLFGG